MGLRLLWSILSHNDCDRMNCQDVWIFHSFAVFAKNMRFGKRRQNQQKVPRVMNTNASDGPGTNSQQVENRREFWDKTKLGQVLNCRLGLAILLQRLTRTRDKG